MSGDREMVETPSVNNRNERTEHGLLKRKTAFYDGNKLVAGMDEAGPDVVRPGYWGVCKAKKELQTGNKRGQRLWLKLIK